MIDNPEEAAKIAKTRSINGRNESVNLEIIKIRNISSISKTTEKRG
jgi:NitT/TauT family transport system substrate-binding protein